MAATVRLSSETNEKLREASARLKRPVQQLVEEAVTVYLNETRTHPVMAFGSGSIFDAYRQPPKLGGVHVGSETSVGDAGVDALRDAFKAEGRK